MSETQKNENEQIKNSADRFSKGVLELLVPIQDGSVTVDKLRFDFRAVTGMEFCEAMDDGTDTKSNAFRINSKQAFRLFAIAAAKASGGVDVKDITQRLSIDDAEKAVQLATLFFNISSNAGSARILDD